MSQPPLKSPPKIPYNVRLPGDLLAECRDHRIDLPDLFERAMRVAIRKIKEQRGGKKK